jgi:hypothetical protein
MTVALLETPPPKAEGDVQSLDVSSYLGRGVRRDALLTAAGLTGTICLRKRLEDSGKT